MSRLLSFAFILLLSVPFSALALEGIGPRLTIVGIVENIQLTQKELFENVGGTIFLRVTNGQLVTVKIGKYTEIISEGKTSRNKLLPINITKNMQLRIRGLREGSAGLNASLIVVTNVALNPALSANGKVESIDAYGITVLTSSGTRQLYEITNETEINVSYIMTGKEGTTLIGKTALLTLNPNNGSQVRILRITDRAANGYDGRQ
jgi:hypothetical protein